MKTLKAILAIIVVGALLVGGILLIVSAIKTQAKFQEQRENSFWECVDNNQLEWCLDHFH